jgi:hypothetical protein
LIPFVPVEKGDSIASEGKGDYMFVEGVVTDLRGNPIPNVTIDTWETDGHGQYDTQVREKKLLLRRLKRHFSMNQEMDLIVEGDSIQLKMVHTPSVQCCERFALFCGNLDVNIYLGLSRILSQMMVLSGK